MTRSIRAVADGLVASGFAALLAAHGFDPRAVGYLVTAALLGSAAMLLVASRWTATFTPTRVLVLSAALMVATGAAFAVSSTFVVLLALALVGPLNPTGGDVSAFLPAEQALIADVTTDAERSTVYARYSLVGFLGAALGAWSIGPVAAVGRRVGFASTDGLGLGAALYAAAGGAVLVLYRRLARRTGAQQPRRRSPLVVSRARVRELAAVFALDSAGGGFVGNAIIATWLAVRFGLDVPAVGLALGTASALSAVSSLLAPRLSRRFGLVETMVFTHAPANVLLIAAGLAPNGAVAVVLLCLRATMSQLDVPTRQTFVMTLVPPEERAAAAAFTNLPRSLAAASTPALAGLLLHRTSFGWPLVIGGAAKLAYDGLLLARFRHLSTRA